MTTFEREKLFEAIAFFLEHTRKTGLVKLFKLLYYADMLHFRETGRGITGLQYRALPYGPVPTDLYNEVSRPREDLAAVFQIKTPPDATLESGKPPLTIIQIHKPVAAGFLTKREIRIVNEVAEIFRDVNAKDISDISHARNGPWDLAMRRGEKGKWGAPIDFHDAVNISFGTGAVEGKDEIQKRSDELKQRAAEQQEGRKRAA